MKSQTAQKKTIGITGRLLHPIEIGLPAWIQECGGVRRTSPVCTVVAEDAKQIVIETQNTIYVLKRGTQYETDH